jgi:hypothetical protein
LSDCTALFDACVFYSAPLRDLIMHLAVADVFRAKWTDEIHEEWIRSLLENRPDLRREQLERTRSLMNSHVRDGLVTGYDALIPTLSLPDEGDRHVLAAAIHCEAHVIVTFNLKDFPPDVLGAHGIEPQHPDLFLRRQLDRSTELFVTAARLHRQSLRNPPKSVAEYLDRLDHLGLSESIAELRRHVDLL